MIHRTIKVVVPIKVPGLRFPRGYRPQALMLDAIVGNQQWTLLLETEEHARKKVARILSKDWSKVADDELDCKPGEYREFPQTRGDVRVFQSIVPVSEFDTTTLKKALESFFTQQPVSVRHVELSLQYDVEAEHATWQQKHRERLEWLARGAPRFTLRSNAPENRITDTENFRDAPGQRQEYAVELVRFAALIEDVGPYYLAQHSWPVGLDFVAQGKRHAGLPDPSRRAWHGYLEGTKQVVIMRSPTQTELIEVGASPDFLPILEQVSP